MKAITQILFLIVLSVAQAKAHEAQKTPSKTLIPQEYPLNISLIKAHLEKMKKLTSIPQQQDLSKEPSLNDLPVKDKKPNPKIEKILRVYEKIIFGKEGLIDFKICGFEDCFAWAQYFRNTILYEEKAFQNILKNKKYKNPWNIIHYILAHELSHFIHQISCFPPYSNEKYISINGLLAEYITNETYHHFSKHLPAIKIDYTHVEVDAYALLLLKKNNFDGWKDLDLFLTDEIKNSIDDLYTNQDYVNRRHYIRKNTSLTTQRP